MPNTMATSSIRIECKPNNPRIGYWTGRCPVSAFTRRYTPGRPKSSVVQVPYGVYFLTPSG
jgi:hypothetical protein